MFLATVSWDEGKKRANKQEVPEIDYYVESW